uniref:LRAT domain-containing protein n=1 Tax=Erpetoichthys calabaricus TaxID=27687 RepID=A0A8C4S1V1_ERPCA
MRPLAWGERGVYGVSTPLRSAKASDAAKSEWMKEGDLIRVRRMLFSHWAVYAGNGSVIHITGKDVQNMSSAQLKVYIKKEKFEKMLAANTFAVASSQYDNRELLGFNFKPFTKSTILERLNRFLDKIYPYSPIFLNCEHFSTFARYGTAISDQVSIESLLN